MILYTIGTGIGGGAIFNNELVFGDNSGLPSEPGHGGGFQNEIQCSCGLIGCIEPVSSATGIERRLNQFAKKSKGKLDIKDLFVEGNEEVREVFVQSLEPLAKSISVLVHFLDIAVIVIGGSPSNLGQPLIDILMKHLEKYCLPDFYKKVNLKLATLTT
ncbi:hypothetical protein FQR65_LT15356 [Abscondita terminalis]|nr:hypothetical protein FQR65_LT15356 [Abscondita terminalis]